MSRAVGHIRGMRSSLVVKLALPGTASGVGAAAAAAPSPPASQDGQQVTGGTAAADGLEPIEDPLPPPPLSESAVGVELLTEELTNPSNSAVPPRSPDAIYVSDQVGPLWRVDERDGSKQNVADLSGLLDHNGGELVFGPDGMLHVQLGDSGGADDQNGQTWIDPDDHGTYALGPIVGQLDGNNAQDLSVPLDEVLPIDVDGRGGPHGDDGIPPDNPFVVVGGALEEISAYGLRSPFQGSIDRAPGDHWVGDVGQNDVEEVAENAHGELDVMGFSRGARAGEGGRIERIVPAGVPVGGVSAGVGSAAEGGTVATVAGVAALGGAAGAGGHRGSCDVAPRCADQPMLRQQEERSRAPWSSVLMFGLAVVLAVAGVLLLLPPRAVGAPLPPATEPPATVIEADGLPDMAGGSARTGPPGGADPVSGPQPLSAASGPPARVSVDAIGVDAPVIPLDVDVDGQLQVPEDFSAVGWWQGGAEPGEPGPTVLVGHVDSYQGPAVFYRLRDLGVGDEVVVTVAGGDSVSYRVTGTQEVPKNDFPTEAVYGHTPGPTLRLITCGGSFDRTTGHYRNNIIVFAELS